MEFGKHEGIVDYGYSLGTDQAVLTKNNEELSNTNTMYRMLGISSPNYQTNEQIELIEGRFLTEDEIRNRAYKIVVDEAITINGEKIKVGDRLTVSIIGYTVYYTNLPSVYKYYSKEIEVLGIYRYKTAFDMSFGKKDAFLNKSDAEILESLNAKFDTKEDPFLNKEYTKPVSNEAHPLNRNLRGGKTKEPTPSQKIL